MHRKHTYSARVFLPLSLILILMGAAGFMVMRQKTSAATLTVSPGQSIAAAVSSAAPGDIVLIRNGSYPLTTLSRQAAGVITIRGESRDGVNVSGFVLSGAANLTLENLKVEGAISGSSGKGAIWIKGASQNITVSGVTINPTSSSGADSTAGIVVSERSHNVSIKNSSISGVNARGGNGRNILLYGSVNQRSAGDWVHDIAITDNDLSGASADNIQITGAYNVTIERNTIRDLQENGDHNDGIQSVSSDNVRIVRNLITDTTGGGDQAIQLGSGVVAGGCATPITTANTYVANNLIHHFGGTGINMSGVQTGDIVNNTIYDNGDGTDAATGNRKLAYSLVLYGGANDTIGCGIRLPQNTNLRIWNNIVQQIYRHSTDNGPAQQTRNIVTLGGSGTDIVSTNPLFVDRTNYRLQSGSPAVNAGLNQTGTPNHDYDGFCRVGVADIGTREFGGSDPSCGGGTSPVTADFTLSGLASGQTVNGDVTVQATPVNTNTATFAYYLDNTLYRTEQTPPYCLGGDNGTVCNPWDSRTLQNGPHVLRIVMTPAGGSPVEKSVNFSVDNDLPSYRYPTLNFEAELHGIYSGSTSIGEDTSAASGGFISF